MMSPVSRSLACIDISTEVAICKIDPYLGGFFAFSCVLVGRLAHLRIYHRKADDTRSSCPPPPFDFNCFFFRSVCMCSPQSVYKVFF